jgi:beta-lactamase regulating signal transducer with metallopeptidase domain
MLSSLLPEVLSQQVLLSFESVKSSTETIKEIQHAESQYPWISILFVSLVTIGFMNFLHMILKHYSWVKSLKPHHSMARLDFLSAKHGIPIFSADIQQAGFLVGITHPVIIVGHFIKDKDLLEMVIEHEKHHARNYDNIKLIVAKFVESIFWFNPIVKKLSAINYLYIEAECDKQTSKLLGSKHYSEMLAKLVLKGSSSYQHNLISPVTNSTNQNVQRLKLLQESSNMNILKKTVFSCSLVLAFFFTSASVIALTLNVDLSTKNATNTNGDLNDLGALVELTYAITNPISGDENDKMSGTLTYWTEFGEAFTHDTGFEHIIKIVVNDEDDMAYLVVSLIEVNGDNEEEVARPALRTPFGQESFIEIDNKEISNSAYSIQLKPTKSPLPDKQKLP